MRVALLVLTGLTFVISGCGGSTSSNNPQNLSIQSGNWSILATSSAAPNAPFAAGGNLSQSGNTISGIIHILNGCFDFSTDIPVSGTVSGPKVTLTSPVVIGEVLTVNATGSSPTALSGTYSLAAKDATCGTNDQGSFTANLVPSISGSWHGSFTSQSTTGTTFNVTANITQSATADAHGFFAVSGTLSFSGSSCFTTGTITSTAMPSVLNGGVLSLVIGTNDQPTAGVMFFNASMDIPAAANAMTGIYVIPTGNCAIDSGSVHITKP